MPTEPKTQCIDDVREQTEQTACRGSTQEKPVSWMSFEAMTVYPRHGDETPVEACGPMQISANAEFYVGATRATNTTGEMQGLIEVLFWLNICVEQGLIQAYSAVISTVDSLCAKGSLRTISCQGKTVCSPHC